MRKNSFFDGVDKFVEFKKLFAHVDGGSLELLDFFGALGEHDGQGRVGRRWWQLRGSFFTIKNVVDIDADSFEFFAENVADAVFTGDVGGDVGCVFGADCLAECYLGFEFLLYLSPESFCFVGVPP